MINNNGDYQSLSQDEPNDYGASSASLSYVNSGSYLNTEREDESSKQLFSKKISFSSGFIMLGSCVLLVTVGLLSLNVNPANSGLSLKSSGGKTRYPKLEPCKADCTNPCGRFKVRTLLRELGSSLIF
jgi:hypothetical protein